MGLREEEKKMERGKGRKYKGEEKAKERRENWKDIARRRRKEEGII